MPDPNMIQQKREVFREVGDALAIAPIFVLLFCSSLSADPVTQFRNEVQPILKQYCYDCHGDGAKKGGVAFDDFKSNAEMAANHELWLKALKNVRAGIMPPPKKPQPS